LRPDSLLKLMEERQASDLYLKVGQPPHMRVNGKISPLREFPALGDEDMVSLAQHIMDEKQIKSFQQDRELDVAYGLADGPRYRINFFYQQGSPAAVARRIKTDIQDFAQLGLPVEPLQKLSLEPRGLVLIAGATGSGKSTTMAAMIEYLNHQRPKHIITIEDPIEFTYREDKCLINQREIGYDTYSFRGALKYVIRQAPDVIVIGEMRDQETMSTAIMAAEVGHLVVSSLHTIDVSQTLERIINFFPAYQHPQIRMQLAFVLRGIVCQRLLPTKEARGRVPAVELLLPTPTARKAIMDNRIEDLKKIMEDGKVFGMQSFNQAILDLYQAGLIDYDVAMENSDNPELLELAIKGIFTGQDTFRV